MISGVGSKNKCKFSYICVNDKDRAHDGVDYDKLNSLIEGCVNDQRSNLVNDIIRQLTELKSVIEQYKYTSTNEDMFRNILCDVYHLSIEARKIHNTQAFTMVIPIPQDRN